MALPRQESQGRLLTDGEPAAGAAEVSSADESHKERIDRELSELLQGLRVMVTGVQVLFAFLLAMPFQSGFAKVDTSGLWLFFIAFTGSATASVCFITPAVQHRLLFRTGLKEKIVHRANDLGLAGAVSLAVAVTAAMALVAEVVLGNWLAIVFGAAVAVATCWLWLLQPIIDLRRQARATPLQTTHHEDQSGDGE
ncbi:DUF6328 family protein [Nonomuraea sp. NPDC050478]|uniref:DUF6328 family protein n=1 Tax=Nonomuraea harbinensis TaxID=1286938 RepID=A0ABW1BM20_9ACTN|nr:DUF6328 family protein [Nonomuraea harbinensis]